MVSESAILMAKVKRGGGREKPGQKPCREQVIARAKVSKRRSETAGHPREEEPESPKRSAALT